MTVWEEATEAVFADENFVETAVFDEGLPVQVIRSKMAQGETLTEWGGADTANFTLHVRKDDVTLAKNMKVDFDGVRYYIDSFELDSANCCYIVTLKSGKQA